MSLDLFTPAVLMKMQRDERVTGFNSTSSWRKMFFRAAPFLSEQGVIRMAEVATKRTIAPFILPSMPGPSIDRGDDAIVLTDYRPAYIKEKDPISPGKMMERTPEEIAQIIPTMTPAARLTRKLAKILAEQKMAINHRLDLMAAQALITAQVVIDFRDPNDLTKIIKTETVAFGRDGTHTVVKIAGTLWSDVGVNPFHDLEDWANRVATAKFGGKVRDIVLGANAAKALRRHSTAKDFMDKNYKGAEEIMLRRGVVLIDPSNPFTYIGTLGDGTNLWQYTDAAPVTDALKDVLGPNQVLLVAPSEDNVMAFGAIEDNDAGLAPTDMFSKQWKQDDPSRTFLMTQSAPLPIISDPNKTLLATVL
jgi:hypothetical protein